MIVDAAMSAPVIVASLIFAVVTALSASFVASIAFALIFVVVIALLLIVSVPPESVASPVIVVAVLVVPLPVMSWPLVNIGTVAPVVSA